MSPSPPRSLERRERQLFCRRNTRKVPVFRDYSETNRIAENGLLDSEGAIAIAFLRRAHAQSGFKHGARAKVMRSEGRNSAVAR
jgi:hypothetical protein